MESNIYRLQDVLVNYDYLRKPLSSMERERFQGEYPYYGAQGIIDFVREYRCDGEYLLIAEDGENLMSRTQPLAQIATGKFWVNNHAHIVKTNELADIRYTCYALNHLDITGYITGSAQPKLSQGNLNKIRIAFPSIEYQKRIVSVLSAYDNLIEVNNKRVKVLEQMAENLYKEWFVRFRFPGLETAEFENGIPKGWLEERLDQFGITLDSGSRPSGGVDDTIKDGMPSLGAEAVNGLGEFDYNSVKMISHHYYASMKRGRSTGSDILVYKDGAYIGKTTIFMNEFPYKDYAVNEHVFLLNAVDMEYQLYLYFTLHLPEYYTLMQNLNRNAAQPGLSKQDVNRIKIVVPEKTVIRKFNSVIRPVLDHVFSLAIEKNNLTKQRDFLLPRLMSGTLEV